MDGESMNWTYSDGYPLFPQLPAMPPHVHASHYGKSQPQQQQQYNAAAQQYAQATTSSVYSNGDSVNSHNSQSAIPGAYPAHTTGMTFGVELSEQAVVPGTEIPKVVQKCTEAIEAFGLDQVGIYRLSGTTSKVQQLKAALDTGQSLSPKKGSCVLTLSSTQIWTTRMSCPMSGAGISMLLRLSSNNGSGNYQNHC